MACEAAAWSEGCRSMDIQRRRSLRAVLAGSLMVGGLTTFSLAATTALTTGTAWATPATLFSSTTAGSYAVAVPGGVTSVTITAVGGTGSAQGGEGAIVTMNAAVAPGEAAVTVGADGGKPRWNLVPPRAALVPGLAVLVSMGPGEAEAGRRSSTEAPRWLSRGVGAAVATYLWISQLLRPAGNPDRPRHGGLLLLAGRSGGPAMAWMGVTVSAAVAAVADTSVAVVVLLSTPTPLVAVADPAIPLPPRSGTPRRRRR